MADNNVELEELGHKSDHLKENALLFEQKANDLENKMKTRGCKIKIIIGVVLISLLLLILVPIITKRVK